MPVAVRYNRLGIAIIVPRRTWLITEKGGWYNENTEISNAYRIYNGYWYTYRGCVEYITIRNAIKTDKRLNRKIKNTLYVDENQL